MELEQPLEKVDSESPYPLEPAGGIERLIADLIDLIILAVIYAVLSISLRDLLFGLGPVGRLVSFAVGVGYFTYFSSRAGRGQTIGKRILNLAVVNADGGYLKKRQAFKRSLGLFGILIFNQWQLSAFSSSPIWIVFISTIFIGGVLSILYAYFFNQDTHQTPYDLYAKSYVVKIENLDIFANYAAPTMQPRHLSWIIGLFGVGLVLGMLGVLVLYNNNLADLQRALNKDSQFFNVTVT